MIRKPPTIHDTPEPLWERPEGYICPVVGCSSTVGCIHPRPEEPAPGIHPALRDLTMEDARLLLEENAQLKREAASVPDGVDVTRKEWLEVCSIVSWYKSLKHDYQRTGESEKRFVIAHSPEAQRPWTR